MCVEFAGYKSRWSFAFGVNQFPSLYFPLPIQNHYWNAVVYGYHLGATLERKRLVFRSGFNTNHSLTPHNKISSVGLELGVERMILKPENEWLLNAGLMFYAGTYRQYLRNADWASNHITSNEWSFGPLLLIGRKFGEHLQVTTDLSISWGQDYVFDSGGWHEPQQDYAIFARRTFGIGARYYF